MMLTGPAAHTKLHSSRVVEQLSSEGIRGLFFDFLFIYLFLKHHHDSDFLIGRRIDTLNFDFINCNNSQTIHVATAMLSLLLASVAALVVQSSKFKAAEFAHPKWSQT